MTNTESDITQLCCEEECVHTDTVACVKCKMPADEVTQDAAEFFKAFSDKTRLRILAALAIGELCVCDIAELLGMTQSAISHQLRFLKELRLVSNRKEGKTVYYTLNDDHIGTILAQGLTHVQEDHH
ncbi:MAG: ArsR/SmtB family transcription factor [Butyricicoccus sp.]